MPAMFSYPHRQKSGQITCYHNRTYHVLTTKLNFLLTPLYLRCTLRFSHRCYTRSGNTRRCRAVPGSSVHLLGLRSAKRTEVFRPDWISKIEGEAHGTTVSQCPAIEINLFPESGREKTPCQRLRLTSISPHRPASRWRWPSSLCSAPSQRFAPLSPSRTHPALNTGSTRERCWVWHCARTCSIRLVSGQDFDSVTTCESPRQRTR